MDNMENNNLNNNSNYNSEGSASQASNVENTASQTGNVENTASQATGAEKQNAQSSQGTNAGGSYTQANADNISRQQAPTYRCDPNNNSYRYTYTYEEAPASNVKKEKPKKDKTPFGVILGRAAAIAAVCGLVGGGIFGGTNYVLNRFTNNNSTQVGSTAEPGLNPNQTGQQQGIEDLINQNSNTVVTTTVDPVNSGATRIVASDVSGIVEDCIPSIVAITNMSVVEYQNFWGQRFSQNQESAASGIIVAQDDEYLYVATNDHVVSGANTLTIRFCDDTVAAAEVKGTDDTNDLAVVQIKLKDIEQDTLDKIRVAVINDQDNVKVGEAAIAIGNALGYGQSVTVGVISALDREVSAIDSSTGKEYTNNLMQTDAAINFGNSGGALLNANGEVIGINSARYSGSSVEGMGFAIPMTKAGPIINQLINQEEVAEENVGYLGISGVSVSASVAQNYGMPEGVCITKVYANAAAYNYGLMKGDIITEFNGQSVTSMENLSELVKYNEAGTTVTVGFYRANNGEYIFNEIQVVLSKKPQ